MSDDFHKHVKNSWHPPSPAPKSASLLIFPLLFSLPGQKICHHLWSSLSLTSQLHSISLFSVPQPLLKIYVRWCHSSTQNSTPSPHLLHSKNQSAYNSLTWSLLLSTSFPTALFLACSISAIQTTLLFLKHARNALFSRSFTDYHFFLESSSPKNLYGSVSHLFHFFCSTISQWGLPQAYHYYSPPYL